VTSKHNQRVIRPGPEATSKIILHESSVTGRGKGRGVWGKKVLPLGDRGVGEGVLRAKRSYQLYTPGCLDEEC